MVLLAFSTASSGVRKVSTESTGPKISSRAIRCDCETPVKIFIYGNPPTDQNAYYIEKIRGQESLCSWTGRTSITQEDLTRFGITSDNGLYHWQVQSWHGALGPARTFTIAPTVCTR